MIRFRGHNYNSQIKHTLLSFRHWWFIKGFMSALWRGEEYLTWFGHGDGCCDYWTPIDSPKAQKAFILDDTLGLGTAVTEHPEANTDNQKNAKGSGLHKRKGQDK
jgi:hypothetical protein